MRRDVATGAAVGGVTGSVLGGVIGGLLAGGWVSVTFGGYCCCYGAFTPLLALAGLLSAGLGGGSGGLAGGASGAGLCRATGHRRLSVMAGGAVGGLVGGSLGHLTADWLVSWAVSLEPRNWDESVRQLLAGIRVGSLVIAALAGSVGGVAGSALAAGLRRGGTAAGPGASSDPAPQRRPE